MTAYDADEERSDEPLPAWQCTAGRYTEYVLWFVLGAIPVAWLLGWIE